MRNTRSCFPREKRFRVLSTKDSTHVLPTRPIPPANMNMFHSSFSHVLRRATTQPAIAALLGLSALPVIAAPVNLNSWTPQNYTAGAGNWVVQPGGTSVLQTLNGNPTVFLSDQSAVGTEIQGKIKVTTTGDDDFVGFVLGFSSGDFSNAAADYLLIDWKQGNQSNGAAGLAVSRVTGIVGSANDFWAHSNAITELTRGSTLGSTGWSDNVEYTFGFVFTDTNLQVFVNGIQQINLNGSFSGGNLGFYNYSQSNVLYSGFTQEVLPPTGEGVPDGGTTASLFAISLLGLVAISRRRLRA
jgi:hypothetical protein